MEESLITTMKSELIERLKNLARKAAAALKVKAEAALHFFMPSAVPDANLFNAASDGNVLDTGKRYRNTSGHSPCFSLYTFFANR